jgi:crotonobetainyl-CoA:carnitine CoA-transferase CaiB-like acyl-CoA transferase
MPAEERGFLAPYRVLDLTDHRGILAGHMLAQLGADVIQMEPPGGSPARREPPFAPGWPAGEDSLFWAAYASGKRGVTCNPVHPEGREALLALLRSADFLIESAAPAEGRPDWLDPSFVRAANPAIVHVTITPFGLDGPKAAWVDSEITLWAAGGPMLPTRDADGRPLRISVPQAYLHAASDAATGALVAHFARVASGEGQHVDVSVQQSVPQATLSAVLAEAVGHPDYVARPPRPDAAPTKAAAGPGSGPVLSQRSKWPVKGGLAEMYVAMGGIVGPSTNMLFAWMKEEGALSPRFHDWDWPNLHLRIETGEITEADMAEARAEAERFIARLDKADLMDIAMSRGLLVAPVQTIGDLIESPHSAARGFFRTLEGPFGSYMVPGDFALGAPEGFVPLRPAPCLGEHNAEVYGALAGLDAAALARLAAEGAL